MEKAEVVELINQSIFDDAGKSNRTALQLISTHKPKASLEFLLNTLPTASCDKRYDIFKALEVYKDESMIEPLLEDIRRQEAKNFPCTPGSSLGHGKSQRYILGSLPDDMRKGFVPEMLADKDTKIVMIGTRMLAEHPTDWGVEQIVSLLDHSDNLVVMTALNNLSQTGLPSAKAPLQQFVRGGPKRFKPLAKENLSILKKPIKARR